MATITKPGSANADNYSIATFTSGNKPSNGDIYIWTDAGGASQAGFDTFTFGNGAGTSAQYLGSYVSTNFVINPANASGVIVVTGASGSAGGPLGKTLTLQLKYVEKLIFADQTVTLSYGPANNPPTGSVTIGGTAAQNQILTASNTLADADGLGPITYLWQANGVTVGTGTTYTLTQSEVGKTVTVTASYTDGLGHPESVSSAATSAVANVNDLPTGSVTISGTAAAAQTLTANNTLGDLDGLGTITYQWKANGTNISGATGATFLVTQAVSNKTISVTASYTDGFGTAESVTSAATSAVTGYNNLPTGTVTISGTATQNQVLTASNSLADADGLGTITYQWYAAGTAISGATTNTLTLAEAQVGKAITVAANYTDGRGNPESVSSAATTAVVNVNDAPTGSVTISGNAASGQTLTASQTLADADGLGTITYQWNANNVNIAGATGTTYLLTTNETNKTITVTASYTDGHGTLESVTSAATAAVFTNHPPTGTVSIAGTATQNQVLTASNNLADVDGLGAITYQWYADGSAITGAVGTTLTLAEAQVGKAITVRASYTDGHGTPESVPSTATASVVNVNDAPVGAVTVSGTATQNQVLTASNTLTDADGLGTITYQWYAAGTAISGATANTLTLAEAQVGKAVTVVASYTDGHGTLENVTSSATAAVANVNDDPTGSVTFTGTTAQGQQLTAANTLADLDGLGAITYQWKADGANVGTGTTYTLTANDVGKAINVVASYTDGHSTLEQVSSAVAPSGVTISSGTVTGSGGTTVTTTTTMPVAASDFVTPSPLVFDSTGNALLNVSLPAGLGLVETELAGTAIPDLATHLKASDTSISIDQQAGIDIYVGTVTDPTQVTVRTITFPVTPVAPTSPLVISGVLSTGQEALVINTTGLASGTILQLNNVEFALVIGAAHITGGVGDNVVYADGSDQYIVLGAGNDELHGGAGNDTIGSLAGDDKLFGDAGNDTLSGGLGNDTLDGGTGIDTAVFSGNFSDYTITYDTGTSSYTIADNVAGRDGIDVVTNVEHFQFLDVTKDDIIAPTVLSFSPADAATGVAVNSDIVVTFSEAVQHGTGTIDIHVGSATATPVLSYNAATNTTNLTFSASAHTLTINPTADLSAGTHYYVTFSNGSIQDAAGNSYTDSASYDFTTADPFAANNGGGGAGIAIAGVGVLGLLAWVLL